MNERGRAVRSHHRRLAWASHLNGTLNPGDHFRLNVEHGLRGGLPVVRASTTEAELRELTAGQSGEHEDNLVRGEVYGHGGSFVQRNSCHGVRLVRHRCRPLFDMRHFLHGTTVIAINF